MIDKDEIRKGIVWEEGRFGGSDSYVELRYRALTLRHNVINRSTYQVKQTLEEHLFRKLRYNEICERYFKSRSEFVQKNMRSPKYVIMDEATWFDYTTFANGGGNLSGLCITVLRGRDKEDFVDVA